MAAVHKRPQIFPSATPLRYGPIAPELIGPLGTSTDPHALGVLVALSREYGGVVKASSTRIEAPRYSASPWS
mgnify:CR=1 FL=1|jgi:hypothetical protein